MAYFWFGIIPPKPKLGGVVVGQARCSMNFFVQTCYFLQWIHEAVWDILRGILRNQDMLCVALQFELAVYPYLIFRQKGIL